MGPVRGRHAGARLKLLPITTHRQGSRSRRRPGPFFCRDRVLGAGADLPAVRSLFVVLLSLVVRRRAERITWRVPAGAVLTVGGAVLVNVCFP